MNKIEFTDKQSERLTDWYLEIKMNKQERVEDKAIKNKILKCLIIIKNRGGRSEKTKDNRSGSVYNRSVGKV